MLLVGALSPLRAALLVVSQILGGITGSAIIQALLPGTLNVRTTLASGVSIARGLFIEMFMTALLMLASALHLRHSRFEAADLTISCSVRPNVASLPQLLTPSSADSLLLAAEKHRGNFIAPLPIGLALLSSELVSGASRLERPSIRFPSSGFLLAVYWTGGSLNVSCCRHSSSAKRL